MNEEAKQDTYATEEQRAEAKRRKREELERKLAELEKHIEIEKAAMKQRDLLEKRMPVAFHAADKATEIMLVNGEGWGAEEYGKDWQQHYDRIFAAMYASIEENET